MRNTLLTAALMAPSLAAAAHAQLPPPPQDGVGADLDCASVYVSISSMSGALAGEASRDPFEARARSAVRAHIGANPPATGQDDASYQALLDDAMQRWPRGLASGVEQLQSLGGPSTPEGMAGFMRLGDTLWEAVQACDTRYGHAGSPSPFAWRR